MLVKNILAVAIAAAMAIALPLAPIGGEGSDQAADLPAFLGTWPGLEDDRGMWRAGGDVLAAWLLPDRPTDSIYVRWSGIAPEEGSWSTVLHATLTGVDHSWRTGIEHAHTQGGEVSYRIGLLGLNGSETVALPFAGGGETAGEWVFGPSDWQGESLLLVVAHSSPNMQLEAAVEGLPVSATELTTGATTALSPRVSDLDNVSISAPFVNLHVDSAWDAAAETTGCSYGYVGLLASATRAGSFQYRWRDPNGEAGRAGAGPAKVFLSTPGGPWSFDYRAEGYEDSRTVPYALLRSGVCIGAMAG